MQTAIAQAFLFFFSKTPLRFNQRLGQIFGLFIWTFARRERCVALKNLEFCYPEKPLHWRKQKAKESLQAMSMALLESPRIWSSSSKELQQYLNNPSVMKDILDVYDQGQGLVIATPHLGNWEYVGQLLAQYLTMTNLFKPPRMTGLADIVIKGRQATGATIVPTNMSGIRALSKALHNGECTGILPDQEPEKGNGIFSNFFDKPAYTMMLLPRLVRKKRTPVVFLFAERCSKGHFNLRYQWADQALYDNDIKKSCEIMNQQLEKLIRLQPSQYNWAYKRFKMQETDKNPYR